MRRSFLLYLFVFSLVVIVIQYVNAKKMMESGESRIKSLEQKLAVLQESNDSLVSENASHTYFSFLNNEEAMTYFEDRGFKAADVAQLVEEEMISKNLAEEDNPLVPYEGMRGHMQINKIKILNHKWVVADFTDGAYWGEVFFTYELNEEGNLYLQLQNSFLYPKN